ncbi:amidohydrolase family protein [Actinoplanes sp. NPDC089786]|uniref:amidohydrolase family protein n=1 Tax=Actinoplanes sp. NPDC089786 TaxID=3155185 RepID=UPI00344AFC71
MTVLRIRGVGLPDGETIDLYADGDRWTTEPAPGAELVADGWILPGLVDVHTHPGAAKPGDPLDEKVLRDDLRLQVATGVTLIRSPGLAGEPPEWFGRDPDVPRAVHAGPWLARHGAFFDGWGRRAEPAELPELAAAQAGRTGWAKIIADWTLESEPLSFATLRAVVERVHAVGGRLAVHSQHLAGGTAAVDAGVDSVEHGMGLDPAALDRMVANRVAFTPTLSVLQTGLARALARPESPTRTWYVGGASAHPALVAAAAEAGVTVLAGTDSRPHGGIATEVRALAAAGVPAHTALGAASWVARDFLGLPGLVDGAPADAVVYARDPRTHLEELDHPQAVILRGVLI